MEHGRIEQRIRCLRCGVSYPVSKASEHECNALDALTATTEAETIVLKAWQELCFKMISAVREFYAPGTTEELSMPKYIRDLGRKAQEYDRIKIGCADMRDLLIEFQNNPNIELGEVGHAKIEALLSRLEQ